MSHLCTLAGPFQAERAARQRHALHNAAQAKVFMAFFFPPSSLPTSHYGQQGTFRATMSSLALVPRFSALPVPWDLPRMEAAQLVWLLSSHQTNTTTSGFKEVRRARSKTLRCANICAAP